MDLDSNFCSTLVTGFQGRKVPSVCPLGRHGSRRESHTTAIGRVDGRYVPSPMPNLPSPSFFAFPSRAVPSKRTNVWYLPALEPCDSGGTKVTVQIHRSRRPPILLISSAQ